tara:strand:+ start:2310 stop:2615 length:306 start_codon:yes stop_codon:yes gene_type:complete
MILRILRIYQMTGTENIQVNSQTRRKQMTGNEYDQPYRRDENEIHIQHAWAPIPFGSLELESICYHRIKTLTKELNAWKQLASDNDNAIERELERVTHEND